MKNKLKIKSLHKNQGITLVALAITVIVMLILAGVAISVIVDGEGLFNRTRSAAEEYESAAKDENTQLQSLMDEIDRYLDGIPSTPGNGDSNEDEGNASEPEDIITFERGSGTESDPYVIVNATQLEYLANQVELGTTFENQYISLEANIELNNEKYEIDAEGNIIFDEDATQWAPIGNSSNAFSGNFDGNNNYISGLYINEENKDYCGLFGTNNGNIENLGIKNSYVKGKQHISLLVGQNNGEIENVIIKSGNVIGFNFVGAISGANYRNNNVRN